MPILNDSRVKAEVLKDKIFVLVRDSILHGNLRPGERLIESQLIRDLGVSRAPIRDAFWALEKQGYVKMTPHKGTFVIELSFQEVEEIYDARCVLESWAARQAKQNAQPQDLKELRQLYRAMERFAKQGDLLSTFNTDMRFHQKIWNLSGNHKIEQILNNICPALLTYIHIKVRSDPFGMQEGLGQHKEILSLLEGDKEPAEVERLVRAAIGSLGVMNRKHLEAMSNGMMR